MPGGVLATSGEVGKASEEACGVLTVSNKIAPAAPKRVPFPLLDPSLGHLMSSESHVLILTNLGDFIATLCY